jgi:hypothetical protein
MVLLPAIVLASSLPQVTNLGLVASFTVVVDGPRVIFAVPENLQAEDLNGDGDMLDSVLHVYNSLSGITTNLALGIAIRTIQVAEDVVVFQVVEVSQGNTDLNGDGDTDDRVLHAYDIATDTVVNLGVSLAGSSSVAHGGRFLAFPVSESDANADLNGDGDLLDRVTQVYDFSTETFTNLGLATGSPQGICGNLVFLIVGEPSQGNTDLNGDGDTRDGVVHVYDAFSGETTNLGLEAAFIDLFQGFIAFCVSERAQGFTDLNGDGDTNDAVVHVYDLETKKLSNLGLAGFPGAGSSIMAVPVLESSQGNTDLNGDGDRQDWVVHSYEHRTGMIRNLGLTALRTSGSGDLIGLGVSERDQGNTDLNGDGDVLDRVSHVYDASLGTVVSSQDP